MPFDSAVVIPPDWSRHHAAAAQGGMNARVTAGVPTGAPVYDPTTDDTRQAWSDDYTGPARIQALQSAMQAPAAGQNITGRPYLVQLELDAGLVVPGSRVKVLEAVNDAQLVGQDLWVVDYQYGSERFTRDMVCSDNQSDAPTT
ncbi:MAG TPA: DUF6093 family protein [Intrasporangium sp.]|uniref:DUF6093 family protein n=1 Tax=Intrasporangium sp. TaxID=1925024 RepID=UPI002D787C02|nr:DUF6093 family protein [Intrasporangium sp.]HET7398991.1 DUF6093 family protein [Intrasporangium sp.]